MEQGRQLFGSVESNPERETTRAVLRDLYSALRRRAIELNPLPSHFEMGDGGLNVVGLSDPLLQNAATVCSGMTIFSSETDYDRLCCRLISLLDGDVLRVTEMRDLDRDPERIDVAVCKANRLTPEYWAGLNEAAREPWLEQTIEWHLLQQIEGQATPAVHEKPSIVNNHSINIYGDVKNAQIAHTLTKSTNEIKD